MTATVAFYLLKQGDEQARYLIACRLAQAALQKKAPLYIHLHDQAEMNYLDNLLWTYNDISFVAHEVLSTQTPTSPVVLGYGDNALTQGNQLLNLSHDVPAFYPNFQRTLEIVPKTGTLKNRLRDHYRIYKDANCNLTTHEVA